MPEEKERKRRWRFSHARKESKSTNTNNNHSNLTTSTLGSAAGAERSTSSVGSASRPRKSFTDESQQSAQVSTAPMISGDVENGGAGTNVTSEKKGPLGWFKGKFHDRQERKEEKERAKSPPPAGRTEQSASKQSLGALVDAPPEVSSEDAGVPKSSA